MKPTISIIIPTYNRAQSLATFLQQLVTQTAPPEEILIIDDHSTDNTASTVKELARKYPIIKYMQNAGRHQREARQMGIKLATGNFIGFFDDDLLIENSDFFFKLRQDLRPQTVIQTKVVFENLGQKNILNESWRDRFTIRPWPVLELLPARFYAGTKPRQIFPYIEFGCFWPQSLTHLMPENNMIQDSHGESYAVACRLHQASATIIFLPSLVVRHPGIMTGGSQRWQKTILLDNFTEFHVGYFHNMVYVHSRYLPAWIWLWLPYFLAKITVALIVNRNIKGCWHYALVPLARALKKFYWQRRYA